MTDGTAADPPPKARGGLFELDEPRARLIERLAKYFTILSTLAGGFYTVWDYMQTRKAEVAQQMQMTMRANEEATRLAEDRLRQDREAMELRRKEFRVRFFEKEMELYLDACRAAATLSNAHDPKATDVERNVDRFYALFWGELCVVADPKVQTAMDDFETALRAWRSRGTGRATSAMRQAACTLALQCRTSLEETFDLRLGKITAKTHADMMDHDHESQIDDGHSGAGHGESHHADHAKK